MALIRPGPLISAITGTIGGVNFATSSQRPIARRARRRVQDQPTAILNSRARLQYLTRLWTRQTANTRAGWATLAATLRWSDPLGQARAPTARALFISHNLSLMLCSLTPDTTTIPYVAPTAGWTNLTLTIPGQNSALFQTTVSAPGTAVKLAIYAQTFYRPTPSLTQTSPGNVAGRLPRRWRFIKYNSWTTATDYDLYPEALPILGDIATGQRIAILGRFVGSGVIFTQARTAIATR